MSQTSQTESSIQPETPIRQQAKANASKREAPPLSKSDIILKKLRGAKGVTIQQLAEATGWQHHSVRGFLSETVRKKMSLNLVSDLGKDGVRRYRVIETVKKSAS